MIIDFRAHHQLKNARLDYQEPAPHRRTKRAVPGPAERESADQQIAHIAWLIRELEDIARGGEHLPQALVAEAHASIERTRKMLQSYPAAWTSGKTDATEGAAQPNIDHALLERMYSDLGLHP
ncbi:hypothetical protein [Reyranella soli]|nr:hypothetical protein [Reyranella soli]